MQLITRMIYSIHLLYVKIYHFIKPIDINSIIVRKGSEAKLQGKLFLYLTVGSRILNMPVANCFRFYKENGYAVAVIIQGDTEDERLIELIKDDNIDFLAQRENSGFDFGGYKIFFNKYLNSQINQITELVVQNDSVYFPACDPTEFGEWLRINRDAGFPIFNLGDSNPHYQSFFIQLKSQAARKMFSEFLDEYTPLNSKVHAVIHGEIALTGVFRKRKLNCDAFFNYKITELISLNEVEKVLRTNMTHSLAAELIGFGFPFMKWDIFSKRRGLEKVLIYGIGNIPEENERQKFKDYATQLMMEPRKSALGRLARLFIIG